jgi:hypothetical protein
MSLQVRYGMTFGSGENGTRTETRLRKAAAQEGKPFSVWVIETLKARADAVLQEAKVGGTK